MYTDLTQSDKVYRLMLFLVPSLVIFAVFFCLKQLIGQVRTRTLKLALEITIMIFFFFMLGAYLAVFLPI